MRAVLKVGDLVRWYPDDGKTFNPVVSAEMGVGLVVGFDHEEDPIVFFTGRQDNLNPEAYYAHDVEALNESR